MSRIEIAMFNDFPNRYPGSATCVAFSLVEKKIYPVIDMAELIGQFAYRVDVEDVLSADFIGPELYSSNALLGQVVTPVILFEHGLPSVNLLQKNMIECMFVSLLRNTLLYVIDPDFLEPGNISFDVLEEGARTKFENCLMAVSSEAIKRGRNFCMMIMTGWSIDDNLDFDRRQKKLIREMGYVFFERNVR